MNKYSRLTKAKKILLGKLFLLNKLLLPFILTITMLFLMIESLTFAGFIYKHLYIDTKIFIFISILMMIVYIFSKSRLDIDDNSKGTTLMSLVTSASYLASLVFSIIYYIMLSIESSNYPNYIFSVSHVNPDMFFYVLIFTTAIATFGFLSKYNIENVNFNFINVPKKLPKKLPKNKIVLSFLNYKFQTIVFMLFSMSFGYFVLKNFSLTSQRIVKSNIYILINKNASYDEKMFESWHFFYKYMKFIKDNTPESSFVAIPPPLRPWLSEGNSVLVRYFLFPRYIVTIEDESGRKVVPDYYIISKGIWKASKDDDYGWPKEKIEAEEIIYLNDTDFSTKVVKNVVYDPELKENKYGWGLIKVKK